MASDLQYMSVPEKIELTNSGPTSYPALPSDQTYQPMKIPDTITLETSDPSLLGMGVSGEVGGGTGGMSGYLDEVKRTEDVRQLHPRAEDVAREKLTANTSSDRFEAPSSTHATPDLEQRVRTLETKVQRLTETVLRNQRNAPVDSGNKYGFWYVMTFAGWMMVPLIVVFMHQMKK